MSDEQAMSQSAAAGRTTVWLAFDTGRPGDSVATFWERAGAAAHVEALSALNPPADVLLMQVVVQGERRRCRLCGQPVVLDDPADPMSWIHAADANDFGDHTAEV
jgi:hypothetical protein